MLAALTLIFVTRGVSAQKPDADTVAQAREHFEKGSDLFASSDFAGAAAEFRIAYETSPAGAFIFNEAVCYERMKDRTHSAELFRRYLDGSPQARDRKAIEERISRLERADSPELPAGASDLRGVVFIESNAPEAVVYLDDRANAPLGAAPWNGSLEGTHTFILVAPGYRDEKKTLAIKPGGYVHLYVGLSQADYLGWLEVRANIPAADVFVDGEESGAIGRTPYMGNMTPGKHTIVISRAGYTEVRRDIQIAGGKAERIDAVLERAPIGFISVSGDVDGAAVSVDGKRVCAHAPCRVQTTSGAHRVSVSRSGRKTFSRTIEVGKATQTDLSVKLAPSVSRLDVIWKFAASAALVGGGAYLTIRANSLQEEIDANPMPTDADKRNQKIFRYSGLGLFAVGGIVAVVGVVSLLQEKGPRSVGVVDSRDLGVSVVPVLAPGYQGVTASIGF